MGKTPPKVTLVKLGGAVITDKTRPNTLRPEVLKRLVQEVKSAWEATKNTGEFLVVGHGAGSFAHVPAAQYDTINGFKDESSRLGMAVVQDSAAHLNRLVIQEFLSQNVPAVSFCPSSTALTAHKAKQSFEIQVLLEQLKNGLLPVPYGDVITDTEIGCTIWSTDSILVHLATQMQYQGWQVSKIVHATQVAGVLHDLSDPTQGMFETITPDNAEAVKEKISATNGTDVTGGMWGKISESLRLVESGVETVILSGDTPGMLEKCLRGEEFVGTRIGR